MNVSGVTTNVPSATTTRTGTTADATRSTTDQVARLAGSSDASSSDAAVAAEQAAGIPDALTGGIDTTSSDPSMKNQFLRLLVAQLQNQDPLTPQEGSEFVAQLAQMTALEQTQETNTRLGELQASQAASLRTGYLNLVGREATTRTTEIKIPQEEDLKVNLSGRADTLTVTIRDADGKAVRTMTLDASKVDPAKGGTVDLQWNGRDDAGKELAEGSYSVSVAASNKDETPVTAYLQLRGIIESLAFEPTGAVALKIGGYDVSPGDIEQVHR